MCACCHEMLIKSGECLVYPYVRVCMLPWDDINIRGIRYMPYVCLHTTVKGERKKEAGEVKKQTDWLTRRRTNCWQKACCSTFTSRSSFKSTPPAPQTLHPETWDCVLQRAVIPTHHSCKKCTKLLHWSLPYTRISFCAPEVTTRWCPAASRWTRGPVIQTHFIHSCSLTLLEGCLFVPCCDGLDMNATLFIMISMLGMCSFS